MSTTNLATASVEILRTDSGCSLEKEFIKLICINLRIVLYQIVYQVDSCHGYVCGR